MKKIIYTRPDGGLSVVHPAINTHPVRENITEDEAVERAWKKLPADAINPRIVDAADIPADRTFRNALIDTGSTVEVNMVKAVEIHKNHLRELRQPMLAALDVEYQRADESGDTAKKAQIAVQKQALRDVTATPAIASARTPEALKAVMPAVLKGRAS